MIDVLIIDGKENRKDGLAALIGGTPNYNTVASSSELNKLYEFVEQSMPDIILINNYNLNELNLHDLEKVQQMFPDLDVLVLTDEDDIDLILKFLRAGVCGLLSTKTTPVKLLDAIQDIVNDGAQIESKIFRKILKRYQTQKASSDINTRVLTQRELEVLYGLSDGKNYREIAKELYISISTVRFHLQNIYRKLNVHSEVEAVSKAIRSGFIFNFIFSIIQFC